MWRNPLCGIQLVCWGRRRIKDNRMPHNSVRFSLQRLEKRHQSLVVMPWFRTLAVFHLAEG